MPIFRGRINRQIYRQSHLIPENIFQHLSRCIEINRRSLTGHLSRCIEIYRFPRCSLAASTRACVGRNGAGKVPASNDLTYCLPKFFRQFFYRQCSAPQTQSTQKTARNAAIKSPNRLPHKKFLMIFLPSGHLD